MSLAKISNLGRHTVALAGAAIVAMGAPVNPALADDHVQVQHVYMGDMLFVYSDVTKTWTITQGDPIGIVDYVRFDVPDWMTVNIDQLSGTSSRLLNRIVGDPNGTLIEGLLNANGHVFFVNEAGITFSNTAVIDVGGIYAAAGTITNSDFIAGDYHFTNVVGDVSNAGSINADSAIHLIGDKVSNLGSLDVGNQGVITMVSGTDVTITPLGPGRVSVRTTADGGGVPLATAAVENSGTITAGNNSQIFLGAADLYALAINNSGDINAGAGSQVTLQAQGTQGDIENSGTITVDTGSSVTLEAENGYVWNTTTGEINAANSDVTLTSQNDNVIHEGILAAGNLSMSGSLIQLGADLTADLATFNDAVELINHVNLNGGQFTFGDTLNSDAGNNWDLDIDGNAVFNGAVGDQESLNSLDITGTTAINGGRVDTIGAQNYAGAVTLGANALLSGSNINFNSTLDGTFDLEIVGDAFFNDNVGGGAALASLDVDGSAEAKGNLTANSGMYFRNGLLLSGNTAQSVNAGSGDLIVDGNLDKTGAGDLALASTSLLDLNGDVTTVAGLTVQGNAEVEGDVNAGTFAAFNGSLQLDGAGNQAVNAGAGDLTVGGLLSKTTGGDLNVSSSGAANLNGGVEALAAGSNLDITADTINVQGDVDVANNANFNHATTAMVNGNVTAGNDVDFNDNATITGSVTATVGNATFGQTATVDGDVTAGNDVDFLDNATVGGDVAAGNSATFGNNADVTGSVTATAGNATFGQTATVDGDVTAGNDVDFLDNATVGGDVTAGNSATFGNNADVTGSVTATAGNATFGQTATVDGDVTAGNDVDFDDDATVGGDVTAGNSATFGNNADVTGSVLATAGNATFGNDANVDDDVTAGNDIDFGDDATVGGDVTAGDNVSFLSGAEVIGSVTATAGNAVFGDNGSVGVNVLAGTNVTFGNTATVGGDVAAGNSASFGDNADVTGSVTATAGNATFGDGATVGSDVFAGMDVNFGSSGNVVGNVDAGNDVGFGNDGTVGGNVTAGNNVTFLDNAEVTGTVDATAGDATFGNNADIGTVTAGNSVQLGDDALVRGQITATAGDVTVGSGSEVQGHVSASQNVEFGNAADIWGGVVAFNGYVSFDGDASIGGGVLASEFAEFGDNSSVTESVEAGEYVTFGIGGSVGGNVDAGTYVEFGNDAMVGGHVLAENGHAHFGSGADVDGYVQATDDVLFGANATLGGDVTATDVWFQGNVTFDGDDQKVDATSGTLLVEGDINKLGRANDSLILAGESGITVEGAVETAGDFTVNHDFTFNGKTVTSGGDQRYRGAVTLGDDTDMTADSGDGEVRFDTTVGVADDGEQWLKVMGDGYFGDDVGSSSHRLESFLVTGGISLNGSVYTVGNQQYDGPMVLNSDAVFNTSDNGWVIFGSTVDGLTNGGESLTINGNARFGGAVGGNTWLNNLDVFGDAELNGGAVNTVGSQYYEGAVTLGPGNTELNAEEITFDGALDGSNGPGGRGFLHIFGDIVFNAPVGDGVPLDGLWVHNGTTGMNGGLIRTTGTQTYDLAVTLMKDNLLEGSLISFGTTLNSDAGNNWNLDIDGSAVFGGAVGDQDALASLDVTGDAEIGGGEVTTTGAQNYTGAVTLTNMDADLSGSNLNFNSTVDGAFALNLVGDVFFNDHVGGNTALASLDVDGTAEAKGDVIATNGIYFRNGLLLSGNAAQSVDAGGADLTVDGNLDKTGSGDLALSSTAVVDLNGDVNTVAGLAVSGDAQVEGNVTAGSFATFNDSLELDGAVDQTVAANGGDLTVTDLVSKTGAGNLNLNASGDVNLNGGVEALVGGSDLNITATNINVQGDVEVANNASFLHTNAATVDGNVAAGNDVNFNDNATITGSVTATAGNATFGNAAHVSVDVDAGNDAIFGDDATVGGDVTAGNNVAFGNTADVGGDVTATAGSATFLDDGTVGGNVLAGTNVTFADRGTVSGNVEATAGNVTFGDDGNADGNVLAGMNVTFGHTGNIGGNVEATAGYVHFGNEGTVTGDVDAGAEIVFGDGASVGGSVTAGDYVEFGNLATVSNDVTATADYVLFGDGATVGGAVSAGTNVTFGEDGTVSGNVAAIAGNVLFGDNATLGADVTANLNITFGGDVDFNGNNLQTVDAGDTLWIQGNALKTQGGAGDLVLQASNLVDMDGDVEVATGGNLQVTATDIEAAGNLVADNDVTLTGEVVFDGAGNQRAEAEGGSLVVNGNAEKTTAGNLDLNGAALVDMNGNVDVADGDLGMAAPTIQLQGNAAASGNATFNGDLEFDGAGDQAVDAGGDLTVTGFASKMDGGGGNLDLTAGGRADLMGGIVVGNGGSGGSLTVNANEIEVQGDVEVDDDATFNHTATALVDGNVTAGNNVTFQDNATVTGGVEATAGDVTFGYNGRVLQNVLAGTNVTFGGLANVQGSVEATAGNATFGDDGTVDGDVTAGTDVTFGDWGTVGGNVHAGEDVQFGDNASVDGNVDADAGFAHFGNESYVGGNVTADQDVDFGAVSTVVGDVDAGTNATFGFDATMGGNVTAGNNITFEGDVAFDGNHDQTVNALAGTLWIQGDAGKGGSDNLFLQAANLVDLDGDVEVTTGGNLAVTGPAIEAAGDLVADNNVTLTGAVNFDGVGDQKAEAVGGDLVIDGATDKTTAGNLDLAASGLVDTTDYINVVGGDLNVTATTIDIGQDNGADEDVTVSGSATFVHTGAAHVWGNVTAGNDVSFQNMATVHGSVAAGNNVTFLDDGTVEENVDATNGDVSFGHRGNIGGNVTAVDGNFAALDDLFVGGDLTTGGDVDVDNRAHVAGHIKAGGDVGITFGDEANLRGEVRASRGDILLGSNASLGGEVIRAAGDIMIGDGVTFDGDPGGGYDLKQKVVANGLIDFAGTVTLKSNVWVEGRGGEGLTNIIFHGAVDSRKIDGHAFGLQVFTDGNLTFHANVGSERRLNYFESRVDGRLRFTEDVDEIRTFGDIRLNNGIDLADVADDAFIGIYNGDFTIDAGGQFRMGAGQRLTALGDLTILADDRAVLSDINTLNDLIVTAPLIQLQQRGVAGDRATWTDFIAGGDRDGSGAFFFSVAPRLLDPGDPRGVQFACTTGDGDRLGTLDGFVMRAFGDLTFDDLFEPGHVRDGDRDGGPLGTNGTWFDMLAKGPTNTDVAEVIAGATPKESDTEDVPQDAPTSTTDLDLLMQMMRIQPRTLSPSEVAGLLSGRAMYLDAPATAVNTEVPSQVVRDRMPNQAIRQVCDTWTVKLAQADRSQTVIREELGEAWGEYSDQVGEANVDAMGFLGFLVTLDGGEQLVNDLRSLNQLLQEVRVIGLTPSELAEPESVILDRIRPADIGGEMMKMIVEASSAVAMNK